MVFQGPSKLQIKKALKDKYEYTGNLFISLRFRKPQTDMTKIRFERAMDYFKNISFIEYPWNYPIPPEEYHSSFYLVKGFIGDLFEFFKLFYGFETDLTDKPKQILHFNRMLKLKVDGIQQ
jgi:hypothetical protein